MEELSTAARLCSQWVAKPPVHAQAWHLQRPDSGVNTAGRFKITVAVLKLGQGAEVGQAGKAWRGFQGGQDVFFKSTVWWLLWASAAKPVWVLGGSLILLHKHSPARPAASGQRRGTRSAGWVRGHWLPGAEARLCTTGLPGEGARGGREDARGRGGAIWTAAWGWVRLLRGAPSKRKPRTSTGSIKTAPPDKREWGRRRGPSGGFRHHL